jgi:hypothetical protein
MARVERSRRASRKRRGSTQWFSLEATILTAMAIALVVGMTVATIIRHDRLLKGRRPWPVSITWDASWPSLPVVTLDGALEENVARALYAFAGRRPDVLKYMPCYCGCKMQGHQSNHDCYVKRRTRDGHVAEWNSHGMTCPIGRDLTGDVTLWTEQGKSIRQIRSDIDQEYSSRGPATLTPQPSH